MEKPELVLELGLESSLEFSRREGRSLEGEDASEIIGVVLYESMRGRSMIWTSKTTRKSGGKR